MKPLILLLGLGLLGACNDFLESEPIVDTKKDESGALVLADTEKNWLDFVETVDLQVYEERQGLQPPGVESWKEHWSARIDQNRKHRENADKYINYILEARKKAGLPPLDSAE